MKSIVNPETKAKIVPTSLMVESGVYVGTDGSAKFSSPEEVMTWRRAVEINGRWWALLHFFDRTNFPQVK